MSTLEVVIDCPECRVAVARVHVTGSGQVSVEWNYNAMEDRPSHPRGFVLTGARHSRSWQTSEVPPDDTESPANVIRSRFWPCTSVKVRCGGRLVLDTKRVRQLAQRAVTGDSFRWHPDAAAVERSEALRPHTELGANGPRTESGRAAHRMSLSEPSPLTEDSIRRLRAAVG